MEKMQHNTDTAAAWQAGHEGHNLMLVSISWGEKAQCDTCRQVIAAWDEEDHRLPYIPTGVTYTPPLIDGSEASINKNKKVLRKNYYVRFFIY